MLKTFISLTTASKHAELHTKHVTMAFMPVQQTGYLYLQRLADLLPYKAFIQAIEYYPQANVTVAIIPTTPHLTLIKEYLHNAGWLYSDYFWRPHITLSSGNKVGEFAHLLGCEVTLMDATIRIKDYDA